MGGAPWNTQGNCISGSIAAWAIWKDYAIVWGMIIAVSQVVDALKDVFPFSKTYKAASEHCIALGSIFIDAQLEWESIFSGRYTNEQISSRRHKLMRLQYDAERHNFPHGLAAKASFLRKHNRRRASTLQRRMVYTEGGWCRLMNKIAVSDNRDKSQIMPVVMLRIPMPEGARVPAQAAPQDATAVEQNAWPAASD
jgi:hypothetical protein